MNFKFTLLIACLSATVLLAGCKGSGASSFSSIFGGSSDSGPIVASVPPDSSGGDGTDSSPISGVHHPEPATLSLLGSGLLAYALIKRKKKK